MPWKVTRPSTALDRSQKQPSEKDYSIMRDSYTGKTCQLDPLIIEVYTPRPRRRVRVSAVAWLLAGVLLGLALLNPLTGWLAALWLAVVVVAVVVALRGDSNV